MNILSVSSEVYPLVKTGGLGDVAGALPIALKHNRIETRTLLPGYPSVMKAIENANRIHSFSDLLGEEADVLEVRHEGVDLLVLDAPAYYNRLGGPYLDVNGRDYPDNWRRFAALSLAGAKIAAGALPGWKPDLVHVHDWQGALTPVYMRYGPTPEIPSLLTIHNIAFQGQFGTAILPFLNLPPHAFWESMEYYGDMNFLKAGINTATAISTVSPSYAEEILTPEFGMGLQGVITQRAQSLHGIVNGIDANVWNPQTDPLLQANYTASTLKKRSINKRTVEEYFKLAEEDGPLFCVISRLTGQKGMDLLIELVDELVANGGRLAVLGSGELALENAFRAAALRHPGRVGISVSYNEPLSHTMQAGCDAIVIPSRFEPCGLTQLYALRYGCIPVVARTGGLNDTVIDAVPAAIAANAATGIQFSPISVDALRKALRRTFRLYRDSKVWTQMQKQGMKSDISWEKSADAYAAVYSGLLARGY